MVKPNAATRAQEGPCGCGASLQAPALRAASSSSGRCGRARARNACEVCRTPVALAIFLGCMGWATVQGSTPNLGYTGGGETAAQQLPLRLWVLLSAAGLRAHLCAYAPALSTWYAMPGRGKSAGPPQSLPSPTLPRGIPITGRTGGRGPPNTPLSDGPTGAAAGAGSAGAGSGSGAGSGPLSSGPVAMDVSGAAGSAASGSSVQPGVVSGPGAGPAQRLGTGGAGAGAAAGAGGGGSSIFTRHDGRPIEDEYDPMRPNDYEEVGQGNCVPLTPCWELLVYALAVDGEHVPMVIWWCTEGSGRT